jgi:hypothetical protein
LIGSRIHEGMVRGAAGPENLPAESQGRYSGRKERLRANPQTMDRDTNRRCQLTRHKRRRKFLGTNHPHRPGLVGSAPQTPRDLSPERQSRRTTNRNGTPLSVTEAPRLRSWLLAQRSGRVSAWPCPLVRLLIILSVPQTRNHCRCARCPNRMTVSSRSRAQQPDSANEPNWVSERTCPESDRLLRVRYTRSWEVVFFDDIHFWTRNPRNPQSRNNRPQPDAHV